MAFGESSLPVRDLGGFQIHELDVSEVCSDVAVVLEFIVLAGEGTDSFLDNFTVLEVTDEEFVDRESVGFKHAVFKMRLLRSAKLCGQTGRYANLDRAWRGQALARGGRRIDHRPDAY